MRDGIETINARTVGKRRRPFGLDAELRVHVAEHVRCWAHNTHSSHHCLAAKATIHYTGWWTVRHEQINSIGDLLRGGRRDVCAKRRLEGRVGRARGLAKRPRRGVHEEAALEGARLVLQVGRV